MRNTRAGCAVAGHATAIDVAATALQKPLRFTRCSPAEVAPSIAKTWFSAAMPMRETKV
jgi:hypothetical protein